MSIIWVIVQFTDKVSERFNIFNQFDERELVSLSNITEWMFGALYYLLYTIEGKLILFYLTPKVFVYNVLSHILPLDNGDMWHKEQRKVL